MNQYFKHSKYNEIDFNEKNGSILPDEFKTDPTKKFTMNDCSYSELYNKYNKYYEYNNYGFIMAVKYNIISWINFWLTKPININLVDYNKKTALMYAVENSNYKLVKKLIHHKANIHIQNQFNNNALSYALSYNSGKNYMIAKYLIKKGLNVNHCNCFETYLLHIAVANNFKLGIKLLLDNKANVNVKNAINGDTPLLYSVRRNNVAITDMLIKHKADINMLNRYNMNALIYACKYNNSNIIHYLLTHDNININQKSKRSPYSLALTENYTALAWACDHTNISVIKKIIKYKAMIDIRSKYNLTPLMLSVINNDNKVCTLLLNKKANVNLKNIINNTPLLIASHKNKLCVIKTLVENKAYLDALDTSGRTPLQTCKFFQYKQAYEYLRKQHEKKKELLHSYTHKVLTTKISSSDIINTLISPYIYEYDT